MATYKYDDVVKKATESGLWDKMSDADRKLAQNNPDAGMSIVNYKLDYQNATTDEQRAAANAGAETVRTTYGNYAAGADGSGFYLDDRTPGTAYSPYDEDVQSLWEEKKNYGDFSFDQENDPVWQSLQKQYLREGERATENVLGEYAAMTGGMPSSYAVTAAAQAGNNYAAELADRLPEIYQDAYERWLTGADMIAQDLELAMGLSDTDYNRELDDINYIANRNQQNLENERYDTEWKAAQDSENKTNAQERIATFFAAGGRADDLDPQLVAASGYTQAELMAMQNYFYTYGQGAATGYSGGGGSYSGGSYSSETSDSTDGDYTQESAGKEPLSSEGGKYTATDLSDRAEAYDLAGAQVLTDRKENDAARVELYNQVLDEVVLETDPDRRADILTEALNNGIIPNQSEWERLYHTYVDSYKK